MALNLQNLLSVHQAASILGCTDGRIRQLLRDNAITGEKLNGRAWIISRDSVERLANKPQTVGRPRVSEK